MRESKYWDDFSRRVEETVVAIKTGAPITIRRCAVFITNKCNFKCAYCNHAINPVTMTQDQFEIIVEKHAANAIIHITGGEPSVIPWLYPIIDCTDATFHLNTNLFKMPPHNVKRLKVSLDSHKAAYFDDLVGIKGAHDRVVNHITEFMNETVLSITYTLTKENYREAVAFSQWARDKFPGLYAIFFSVYKGTNERFRFDTHAANDFFYNVMPALLCHLDAESIALIKETIDEKKRIMEGVRFPENLQSQPCWLSMSERVYAPDGSEYGCSHLYRDGIYITPGQKHEKCLYGCNRRLVEFNCAVNELLGKG